jgi:hypothetical protein
MIVEAIDKRTGRIVRAEDAYSGQRLECRYCGVDVHPVLGVETPFYRCYEGGKHTNCICKQLDRSNRVYDPQLTDIAQLFDNLFHPVREKEEPSWEFDEDEGLVEIEPEDEYLYGDESEYGTDADTDESKEEEGKPTSEPVILPCRTLSQLWKAEIKEFRANDRVGSHLRSDIFLWYKDFDDFFACRGDLGKRVLAVRPRWPVNKSNAILFDSFSMDQDTKEYKNKNFVLVFDDRREYNQACKKLFVRNTKSNGISSTAPKYSMVLVAGDWTELNEEKYLAYTVRPRGIFCGAQIADFSSKNQIYALQEFKIKETKAQRS